MIYILYVTNKIFTYLKGNICFVLLLNFQTILPNSSGKIIAKLKVIKAFRTWIKLRKRPEMCLLTVLLESRYLDDSPLYLKML